MPEYCLPPGSSRLVPRVGKKTSPSLDVDRGDAPGEDEHGLGVAVAVNGVEVTSPNHPNGVGTGWTVAAAARPLPPGL